MTRGGCQQLVGLRGHALEQRVEELLFETFVTALRRIDCELELFKLRRYVSLAVGKGLPAHVLGRKRSGIASAHFNGVAEGARVLDFERLDAGALAFARFQLGKFRARVGPQRGTFRQLGVGFGTYGDAVAELRRRVVDQRSPQILEKRLELAGALEQREYRRRRRLAQRTYRFQGPPQRTEIARRRAPKTHLLRDALEVEGAPKYLAHRFARARARRPTQPPHLGGRRSASVAISGAKIHRASIRDPIDVAQRSSVASSVARGFCPCARVSSRFFRVAGSRARNCASRYKTGWPRPAAPLVTPVRRTKTGEGVERAMDGQRFVHRKTVEQPDGLARRRGRDRVSAIRAPNPSTAAPIVARSSAGTSATISVGPTRASSASSSS